MNVYLIRHPRPDVDAGTCYGSMDIELEAGWQQDTEELSSWLFSRLKGRSKSFHSPLIRAALLAQHLIPDSIEVEALSELDFGDWEGRLWQDISKNEIDLWAENITHANPYNGESLADLNDRVLSWWHSMLEDLSQLETLPNNLVIVTHSGVIKVLVSQLCHWPLAQSHMIDPAFLSVTELSILPSADSQSFVALKRLGAGDWV